jgi:hypothetical protein
VVISHFLVKFRNVLLSRKAGNQSCRGGAGNGTTSATHVGVLSDFGYAKYWKSSLMRPGNRDGPYAQKCRYGSTGWRKLT